MRVTLGIPLYGIGVDSDIYENHIVMVASSNGLIRNTAMPKNELIHFARNKIVKQTLEDEFTNVKEDSIFWLDQDVIVAPGVLMKLIQDNKEIVTGLYFQKAPPFYPLILGRQSHQTGGVHSNVLDYPEGLHKLENGGAIGFGCVLTKLTVFEKIPEPWFEWTKESGEDVDFSMKCRKYGVDIWYDSEVLCGHQSDRKVVTYDDFKPFRGRHYRLQKGE